MSERAAKKLNVLDQVQVVPPSWAGPGRPIAEGRLLLFKPPFFTPWTPPLGIGILKSHLERHGYSVRCVDLNTDVHLWNLHHNYFRELQSLETVSINDGYSKLWWILNAHLLAHVNGASPAECAEVVGEIAPLYAIHCSGTVLRTLSRLVDEYYQRLTHVLGRLDMDGVTVAGTSTYTTSLASSLFVLRSIKAAVPEVTTVMGGGVFADDLALGSDNLETLVRDYPFVDYVVLGEGEELLLQLLRGNVKKRVVSIADLERPTMEIAEVPAPDFSDLDTRHYYHLTIEGARSCPFECTFCSETIQWGKYRKKPMELLVDQMQGMADRYGSRSFFMGDSLMNPYIMSFSSELLKRDARIAYDGYLRADKVAADGERTAQWARSGLYRVRLGVESASAHVLTAMQKMTTPEIISDALKHLARQGVRTTTYWIVGFPGETESDFEETLEFVREHHRDIYELEAHPFYFYPYGQVGSRLYKCHSLYPESVAKWTKFAVWDVDGVQPDRYERYRRLRTMSKLAAELGLLNIYTMEARFDAEERWQRLHPLAAEVYSSTMVSRTVRSTAPTAATVTPAVAGSWIGHWTRIAAAVDPAWLKQAIHELSSFEAVMHDVDLTIDDSPAAGDREQRCRELARTAGHGPAASGARVRVVLLRRDAESDLVVLADRGVTDEGGLKALVESLFRVYSQISVGHTVSLPPLPERDEAIAARIEAARATWACRAWSDRVPVAPHSDEASRSCAAVGRQLDAPALRSQLARCGVGLDALLLGAVLQAVADVHGDAVPAIDLSYDYRAHDPRLTHVPGPLTYVQRLHLGAAAGFPQGLGLPAIAAAIDHASRWEQELVPSDRAASARPTYFVDAGGVTARPVMDDRRWSPAGYLHDGTPRAAYALELRPSLGASGAGELTILYPASTGDAAAAAALATAFAPALDRLCAALDEHDRHVRFWAAELEGLTPVPRVASWSLGRPAAAPVDGLQTVPIATTLAASLATQYGATIADVLLTAYTFAVSWMSGERDVVLIASTDDSGTRREFPLRVRSATERRPADLLSSVTSRYAAARDHRADAVRIADRAVKDPRHDRLLDYADMGFALSQTSGGAVSDLEALFPSTAPGLSAVLHLHSSGEAPPVCQLVSRGVGVGSLRVIAEVMDRALEELSHDEADPIAGAIAPSTLVIPSASLAADTFAFTDATELPVG
jgi:radical SAM superfamily enzyme YgiQ (UPF0313 family)